MQKAAKEHKKRVPTSNWLSKVEAAGNRLPDPAVLFICMGVLILILSAAGNALGWQVENPSTGETVAVTSLLTGEGIRRIINSMLTNLSGFGPLPSVILVMMGLGVAEGTGMLKALLTKSISKLPQGMVTVVLIFIAISSNVASDSGFIVLPPLAALIFLSMNKHPFIGIAATYGAVAAGFNACIFLCTGDVLVAGMTETAARIIDPNFTVNPAVNYYFMALSCIPLAFAGAWVTKKFVEPRYQDLSGIESANEKLTELTPVEIKGLKNAGLAVLAVAIIIGIGILPGGVLRDAETGTLIPSPFINGMVFFMTVVFLVPGIVYGKTVGVIKKDSDAVKLAAGGVASISGFLVLAFVASQFIAWFGWSNLGIFVAISGAEWLKGIGLSGIPLAIGVVFLCCIINIFIGSQTAKWALVSSIFVPMLMLLDFHPALTQLLYRIGDSVTNPISPLFTYFPLMVGFLRKYNKKAGMGTAFSLMLPYSITFLLIWLVMLVAWILLGLPLGPGGNIWLS